MSLFLKSGGLVLAALVAFAAPPALARDAASTAFSWANADALFEDARVICTRDNGRLWGHTLCGPMMLVEPESRAVIANQADGEGVLKADGGAFTGVLPLVVNLANTPTEWAGVRWTQILWPLMGTHEARQVMIAHELFHRIQPMLGMLHDDGDNGHLDTLEGRYLLQLEWRALAAALTARTEAARRRAVDDALAFRAERYRLFPDAAANERGLELNEGVAEYTGVMLGLRDERARTAYAVRDLTFHIGDPTFVRSFAYATGPAYGLLLDRYAPGWRSKMKSKDAPALDRLLRAAVPTRAARNVPERSAAYAPAPLRAFETDRDAKRQAMLSALHARFVDGPVLCVPSQKINYQFNPSAAQPLAGIGTVYPRLRVTGAFGILETTNGGLLGKNACSVSVPAAGADMDALKGDGWTLTLNPGWSVKPGARAGDWVLVGP
ncbi:MAG: hypothetical protein JWP35_4812 [Caulobacter sp.]|nr:hypothetical protein [Caulobacter sp.]